MDERGWALSVDYGSSNTVAAVIEVGQAPRLLQFVGQVSLPSAVFVQPGSWLTGHAAERAGQAEPAGLEPTPKRLIEQGLVFVAGQQIPVQALIGATLRAVFEEAWRQQDRVPPEVVVLTHPAVWGPGACEVLLGAAREALPAGSGGVQLVLVPEPVAAAWHASQSRVVPAQARIAVLDLGGGTCDVAVVDRDGDRFQIAGQPRGLPALGGEDFDIRLLDAVLADLGRPELHEEWLGGGPQGLRAYRSLRRSCREAKEQLSSHARTSVLVPLSDGSSEAVQVSRSHLLERLLLADGPLHPGLDTAADLVAAALQAAPPTSAPVFVFLVGGSSRIPLLGHLVQSRTGHAPLEHGDPGTAVAEGGARIAKTFLGTGRGRGGRDREQVPSNRGARTRRGRVLAGGVAALVVATGMTAGVVHLLGTDQGGRTGLTGELQSTVEQNQQGGTDQQDEQGQGGATPVLCWDDSHAPAGTCPVVDGQAGLQWVFADVQVRNCRPQAPSEEGIEIELVCELDGQPDVNVYLNKWRDVRTARSSLTATYGEEPKPVPLGSTEEVGLFWSRNTFQDERYWSEWLYRDYPFSQTVSAPTEELQDKAVAELNARDPQELRERGGF